MAINVSFGGATIYRPQSYSKTTIDVGGGFPLGASGLVAVIGEADAGTPGASEVNLFSNRYTADQMQQIRNKYRSGPIADAASFLFSPAADAAIPSGAQTVWFYKTNASVRAQLALANTYGTLRALEWGVGGNRISAMCTMVGETFAGVASSAAFDEATIVINSSFVLYVNGVKNTFTFLSAPADNAGLVTALANAANWGGSLPVGVTITVGGVDHASTVSIAPAAAANQYRLGFGRSFQLVDGTIPSLSVMNIVPGFHSASVEPSVTFKISQKRDILIEESTLGGNIVLTLGHDGTGGLTAAAVSITDTSIILKENGTAVHTIAKSSYPTILELVNELNLVTYGGWSAALTSTLYNQLGLDVLDQVSDVGALAGSSSMPARIKKDASEMVDMLDNSTIAEFVTNPTVGLPAVLVETMLSGGSKGITNSASIVDALAKFEKFHVNFILPLFSRDATSDVTDALTESGSTYTIAGIHQAVKSHISLMKTIKKRSERQAVLSIKDTYENCKTQAGSLADGRIQLVIQDVRQNDAQGNIKWFQPWALATILTGARSGAPIGEPMTFKFMNVAGIRQTGQAMTTPDANIVVDFDPDLQTDDAIISGVTFLEAPQTGGYRWVVDNTTYGRDTNFFWNRANVIYAGDTIAYNFRNAMETFIGKKNTITPQDVAGVAASVLGTFLGQGLTVSTPDAAQGYKGLSVRIEGNTVYISVIVKIIEGIDFVLSDLVIQRAVQ